MLLDVSGALFEFAQRASISTFTNGEFHLLDLRDRLIRCFQTVFPDLDSTQIPEVQLENTAGWDSITAVVLLSVIEEEFDLRIPPSEIGRLQSFTATLAYLTPLTDV